MSDLTSQTSKPINLRRKIFEFIVEHHQRIQRLPSRDEIRKLFGGFTDDVDLHLEQLAREGLLVLDRDGSNGISLVPTYTPAPLIKLLGRVAPHLTQPCGSPYAGSIALDLRGIGVPLEAGLSSVQVLDDRMSDAGIEYGDIGLLAHTTPMRGDIVAVKQAEVLVLRRYVVIAGIPHFLAENPVQPDLRPGWDTKMEGVLWGLIRAKPCRHPHAVRVKKNVSAEASRRKESEAAQSSKTGKAKKSPARSRTFRPPIKATGSLPNEQVSGWPKPPFGIQLNEAPVSVGLTDSVTRYEPWGDRYPHDQVFDAGLHD